MIQKRRALLNPDWIVNNVLCVQHTNSLSVQYFILKSSVCSEKSLNSHQYSLKHCSKHASRIESFTSVVRLATQVHELSEIERKYWIKFAKLQNTNAIRVYDKEAEHILTHLLLVIPLVYKQSLVIVVNFSFVSSLVTFSCIQFIFCKHDPPRLAQLPAGML